MADDYHTCKVEGCNKKAHAAGYCGAHYNRLKRHGTPFGGAAARQKRFGACKIDGCDNAIYGRGYCKLHWRRWRDNGDPRKVGRTPKGTIEAWLKKHATYRGSECLIWPFFRKSSGYGTCHFRGIGMISSRAMCILAHGDPPSSSHHAAHKCGNGDNGCVNPNHLRWATPVENCCDMVEHGTRIQGEECWAAKLTESDVRIIRSRYPRNAQKTLAAQFRVSRATIGDVLLKRTWKHVK